MKIKDFLRLYRGHIMFITNSYLTDGKCNDNTRSPLFKCWNADDEETIMKWFKSQDENLENAFVGTATIVDSVHGMSEDYYKRNPEHKHTYLQVAFNYN